MGKIHLFSAVVFLAIGYALGARFPGTIPFIGKASS